MSCTYRLVQCINRFQGAFGHMSLHRVPALQGTTAVDPGHSSSTSRAYIELEGVKVQTSLLYGLQRFTLAWVKTKLCHAQICHEGVAIVSPVSSLEIELDKTCCVVIQAGVYIVTGMCGRRGVKKAGFALVNHGFCACQQRVVEGL